MEVCGTIAAPRLIGNSALSSLKSENTGILSSWSLKVPGNRNLVFRLGKTWKASAVRIVMNSANGNGAVATKFMPKDSDLPSPNFNNLATLQKALSITEIDRNQNQALRVAYQGIPGAYSEEAALVTHPGCRGLPCQMYEIAVRAVERRDADRAILPVESTVEGSIHPNYDLLLDHRLHVVGEIHFPVNYCLLVAPGVKRAEIKRVMSHPLAISQCKRTLTTLGLINVTRETTDDTAGAAEFVSCNNLRNTAAIASARAAEIYGLDVLARGIQDESCNLTRFLILARDPVLPANDRPYKTSIVVAHYGGADVLFRVLSAFSFRNINLTKLESRPRRNNRVLVDECRGGGIVRHFQYVFYIDFEASVADKRAQNALSELKEFTTFLRVLGSYPADPKVREL